MAGSTAAVVLRRVGLGCRGRRAPLGRGVRGDAGARRTDRRRASRAEGARRRSAMSPARSPPSIARRSRPRAAARPRQPPSGDWWDANSGRVLAALSSYDDPLGKVGLLADGGPMPTAGHPFFTPLGSNGRACVSCHQPSDGMSLVGADESSPTAGPTTGGRDPLSPPSTGPTAPARHSRGRRPIRCCSTKAVPNLPAVAAEGRRRLADQAGIPNRGRQGSDGLQSRSGLRPAQRQSDDLGVPPPKGGGQPALCGQRDWRPAAPAGRLQHQDRHALGGRP